MIRAIEVALSAFLLGGLGVMYLRVTTRPRLYQPMFWGGISAMLFIFIALISEVGHLGQAITWKTWLGMAASLAGLNALRLTIRYRGKH